MATGGRLLLGHLDTHIAITLFDGRYGGLSKSAQYEFGRRAWFVSPLVLLEIELLREGGLRAPSPSEILKELEFGYGVTVSATSLTKIVAQALRFAWTGDPYDRLIVAHAMADGAILITRDKKIRDRFGDAIW